MQYNDSYTHTNLSIFNCYLNISVWSTHTQYFYMVIFGSLLIYLLPKRTKSESLDLRPNSRKSLIFQAFSHFHLCTLVISTTLSTWLVIGNISTGCATIALYPCCSINAKSRAKDAELQDT